MLCWVARSYYRSEIIDGSSGSKNAVIYRAFSLSRCVAPSAIGKEFANVAINMERQYRQLTQVEDRR